MKTTKRAALLATTSGFTAERHPAIFALIQFAAQNSGLDFANYGDRKAYASEARSITADFARFRDAVHEAAAQGVTDAEALAEAPHAFSGRLEWKAPQSAGDPTAPHWDYCTGQYFPTEYRKAAANLIEAATKRVRQSRPAVKRAPRNVTELAALNAENGGCWFDRPSMRFFGTRIESQLWATTQYADEIGRFITSEQPPHGSRRFTIRTFDADGSIGTAGELCGYATRREALKDIFRDFTAKIAA